MASHGETRLDETLRRLEREAKNALPGFDASIYNRAGDHCVKAGRLVPAQRYFGAAIDAYLGAGRYEAAAAICRKLLRLRPRAVRPRCTLAWLSIGQGHDADARSELEAYAEAARRAGQARYAVRQLRLMADVVDEPDLLRIIAAKLRLLNDEGRASEVETLAAGVAAVGQRPPAHIGDARWAAVLRAALMGPTQLESDPTAVADPART